MKIIVLDDDGNTIYEEDNPGHIHMPIICNGIFDVSCEDNDCLDPRCVERRDESEKLISKWQRTGCELAFAYHFPREMEDSREYKQRPNFDRPLNVQIHGFTRNEIVLKNGDRLPFMLPDVNMYSTDQVTFSTGKWEASLSPWRDEYHKKTAKKQPPKKSAKKAR